MHGMGQRGFWREQQRVVKFKNNKIVPQRLSESIPWQSFRLLEKVYPQERKAVLVGGELIR